MIGDAVNVGGCCTCGVTTYLPSALYEQRKRDGRGFRCPNGHTMFFDIGPNKLEQMTKSRDTYKAWYDDEYERRQKLERRVASLRGHITRLQREKRELREALVGAADADELVRRVAS